MVNNGREKDCLSNTPSPFVDGILSVGKLTVTNPLHYSTRISTLRKRPPLLPSKRRNHRCSSVFLVYTATRRLKDYEFHPLCGRVCRFGWEEEGKKGKEGHSLNPSLSSDVRVFFSNREIILDEN